VIYQGRDARDDAVLNPSPVVAELLDYLRQQCPHTSAADWIRQQPVHRFSMASFRGERPTYDADWLAAACALTRPLPGRAEGIGAFAAEPGTDPAPGPVLPTTLSIADLSAALVDPQRHWWTVRFGLRLPYQPLAPAEIEPLGEPLERDATLLAGLIEGLAIGRSEADLIRETALLPALASGRTGGYQARLLVGAARRLLAPVSVFLRPPPAKVGARVAAPPPQVDPGTLERMGRLPPAHRAGGAHRWREGVRGGAAVPRAGTATGRGCVSARRPHADRRLARACAVVLRAACARSANHARAGR
jgi:exonuclease V gamma subunit